MYLTHFVAAIVVGAVLYMMNRERFRRFAKMFLAFSLAGYATYVLYPAIPPWLASKQGALPHTTRAVHTIWDNLGLEFMEKVFSGNPRYSNPVGALPSEHGAYPLLFLLLFWAFADTRVADRARAVHARHGLRARVPRGALRHRHPRRLDLRRSRRSSSSVRIVDKREARRDSLRCRSDRSSARHELASALVTYELDEHVAVITYNRPDKLNAINGELRTDLNAAWERFRGDDDAWVAIVTGAGRAFCVGADLHDGAGSAGTWPGSFWEIPTVNSFESGLEIWKPTIAAVNGYCLGYGLTLVSACDFVIAADDAEFGMPEVRLGVPTIVGAMRLPQRIGMQSALELLLTGDRIDAVRAQEIGLAGSGRAPGRAARRSPAARAPALPGSAPGRPGGQGDGVPRPVPAVGRRGAHGRDDAPRRGADRRRPRGHGRGPRGSRTPVDRPLRQGRSRA